MFLDVTRLAAAITPDNRKTVFTPEIAGRFIVSLEGLSLLQNQVNDMVKQLRAQGKAVRPDDIEPRETV